MAAGRAMNSVGDDPAWLNDAKPAVLTYQKRRRKAVDDDARASKPSKERRLRNAQIDEREAEQVALLKCSNTSLPEPGDRNDKPKTVARKRAASQYFLDFGQSDFSYTSCAICGLMYAKGQEQDKKVHESFHKSYLQGISFKGWQNERVVTRFDNNSRVIAVLPGDPVQHHKKVKEAVVMMEKEMGLAADWLMQKDCKVYLYVASKRVLGCIVVEPIEEAFRVIAGDGDLEDGNRTMAIKKEMMFGNIKFVRELHRRNKSKDDTVDDDLGKEVECEKQPLAARLGIRGLWVTRSSRKQGIATKLVDAVRTHCSLDKSECAFSQPTPQGAAFATKYFGTKRFLVYSC